jgi:hypothetical protein
MMSDQAVEMALVATVYPPEDIFIKGLLETEGIEVFTSRESIAGVYGITFGDLAAVKIYVAREDESRAREVLAAADDTDQGQDDAD